MFLAFSFLSVPPPLLSTQIFNLALFIIYIVVFYEVLYN